MLYTIMTVPGRNLTKVEANTAELAVRSQMCWYNEGTLFIVIDENNKAEYFRKVKSDNAVSGFAYLVKEEAI